jgi:hypothetical protein
MVFERLARVVLRERVGVSEGARAQVVEAADLLRIGGLPRIERARLVQEIVCVCPFGRGRADVPGFPARDQVARFERAQVGDSARNGERRERGERGEECRAEDDSQLGLAVLVVALPPPSPAASCAFAAMASSRSNCFIFMEFMANLPPAEIQLITGATRVQPPSAIL